MRAARIAIVLVALATLAAAPAQADLWIESVQECGGTAPAVTACTTRFHLRTLDIAHGFRLSSGDPYTGTLESRLESLLGTQVFRCTYVGSVRQGSCVEEGMFPQPVSLYRHRCSSFALSTATPGGSGPWTCFTAHSTGLFAVDAASSQ